MKKPYAFRSEQTLEDIRLFLYVFSLKMIFYPCSVRTATDRLPVSCLFFAFLQGSAQEGVGGAEKVFFRQVGELRGAAHFHCVREFGSEFFRIENDSLSASAIDGGYVGTGNEDAVRAETECFENINAGADSAVDKDLPPSTKIFIFPPTAWAIS